MGGGGCEGADLEVEVERESGLEEHEEVGQAGHEEHVGDQDLEQGDCEVDHHLGCQTKVPEK